MPSKTKYLKRKAGQQSATRLHYGALPYRETKAGLEILLVTSRQTRRRIVPKGWPIKGLKPSESAAREAYEEAGVRGNVGRRSIGAYVYNKLLADKGIVVPCEVRVFALSVTRHEKLWPEYQQREVLWHPVNDAISAVEEAELKSVIEAFMGAFSR